VAARVWAACLALLLCAAGARAGECTGFGWPVDVELGWMKASGLAATPSGARFAEPPERALELALAPSESAKLPVAPSGAPQVAPPKAHAGFVVITRIPTAGVYQVSLSGPAWIDVVQSGSPLPAQEHTSVKDCAVIHKSVRFALQPGPATLEVSSAPGDRIRLAIRRAE
jgi:hypothetical protein